MPVTSGGSSAACWNGAAGPPEISRDSWLSRSAPASTVSKALFTRIRPSFPRVGGFEFAFGMQLRLLAFLFGKLGSLMEAVFSLSFQNF